PMQLPILPLLPASVQLPYLPAPVQQPILPAPAEILTPPPCILPPRNRAAAAEAAAEEERKVRERKTQELRELDAITRAKRDLMFEEVRPEWTGVIGV